jgi:hypothetical protein
MVKWKSPELYTITELDSPCKQELNSVGYAGEFTNFIRIAEGIAMF